MAAALRYDWEAIRAEYEAGASQSSLSQKYGVSRKAIQKRIASEGWMQDVTGMVNRLAVAKVAGIVAGCDPQKKAEAIEAAAEQKAAVMAQHRAECALLRENFILPALTEPDVKEAADRARAGKVAADMLKAAHETERKAWGIQDQVEADLSGGLVIQWHESE